MSGPPNEGMKLTNLSEAPGKLEAPLRAFRRFAAVRTGSQLIPGVSQSGIPSVACRSASTKGRDGMVGTRVRITPIVAVFLATAPLGAVPWSYHQAAQPPSVRIDLAHNTEREQKTKEALEQVLATYNLSKYTFTRRVVIQEGAVNHAMPVLTLNVRFALSPDDLLSSYIHEQLHWHTQGGRSPQQQGAVAELRRLYPRAPVGLPEGAERAFSTYGHLVVCYLEMVAGRELLGPERARAVIARKDHYTWIYATVVRDEGRIAAVVDRHGLRVR
jgi:hypothetical protein